MDNWRVDLCQRSYAAFRKRDADAAAALYDPECEWLVGAASAALGETAYHGHIGVQALMSDINEVFPDWDPVIEELRLRDDGAALVRARVEGTARDTRIAARNAAARAGDRVPRSPHPPGDPDRLPAAGMGRRSRDLLSSGSGLAPADLDQRPTPRPAP